MSSTQGKRIKEWIPLFETKLRVTRVEGYLEGDEQKQIWASSEIKIRENARTLITKSGGKYILVGNVNRKGCIQRGLPEYIIDQFADGFPEDWKNILFNYYTNRPQRSVTAIATTKTKAVPIKKKTNLVEYSSDSDSENEKPPDNPELHESDSNAFNDIDIEQIETGNTPIRPSRITAKRIQDKLKVFESSSSEEEEENFAEKEVVEKVRKKRTVKAVKDTKKAPIKTRKKDEPVFKGLSLKKAREKAYESSREASPMDFDDHPVAPAVVEDPEPVNLIPKKWTSKEKERFLELLKFFNPVNDFDWERLQANNKSDRTVEELKTKATELNWEPLQNQENVNTSIHIDEITARPGTAAYIIQANKVNQDYLAAKNRNAAATDEHIQETRDENFVGIQLDDSTLSIFRTPVNPKRQRNAFNPTFDINLDGSVNESSSFSDSKASISSSPMFLPKNNRTQNTKLLNDMKILMKNNKRNNQRHGGQNSTLFTTTDTTAMTTTLNFIQHPKPSRFAEDVIEEDDEMDEGDSEMDDSMMDEN